MVVSFVVGELIVMVIEELVEIIYEGVNFDENCICKFIFEGLF